MSHLLEDLRTIGRQSASVLEAERRRHSQRPAFTAAFLLTATIATVYLAYLGVAHWTASNWPAAPLAVLAGTVFGPGVLLFVIRVFAANRRVSKDEALAAADERHDLADRLRTAAEFLKRPARTSFMEAALLDAAEFADRLKTVALPGVVTPEPFSRGARIAAFATLVIGALALWIPEPDFAAATGDKPGPAVVAELGDKTTSEKETPKEQPVEPREKEKTTETHNQQLVKPAAGKGRKDAQLDSSVKNTRGVMGSGQSADAASATGSSEARGAPSSQAQASKTGKKPTKKKKVKPKKHKKPNSEPNVAKKPENDSGATAGRGAASGSNKSPSASPWSSKDQITSEDEDDLEDDEEVDDEFDNSDARGGMQPHLRDRRPPVNRDLGIGFGNDKNPDANGRGGPSEMKKSRGVAALVLGVPIPDHVKGRPNPGKTKITQERVEPRVEDAQAVDATARQPRQSPVGHFANPELESWMRDLIRTYFKAIRAPKKTPPPQPEKSGD